MSRAVSVDVVGGNDFQLVLAAIHHRSGSPLLSQSGGQLMRFDRPPHLPGAHQRFPNVPVLGIHVERDQPVALLTIGLKSVADLAGALAKNVRAFRTFDFDLFVDHINPPVENPV
jgi:hypothetical protein